jgi:hypothetical protein
MSLRKDGGVWKFVEIWQDLATYLRVMQDEGRHLRTPEINGYVGAFKCYTDAQFSENHTVSKKT